MKTILLILLFVFLSNVCKSQNDSVRFSLKVSYFGEMITHPGIKFGVEYPFYSKKVIRANNKGIEKQKKYKIFSCANIGLYTHPQYNSAFFLNTELGYRYIRTNGFVFETSIGIGYLRTFLNGKTYEVTNNGIVKKVFMAGSNSLMPSITIGFGHDMSNKNRYIDSWYIKPVVFLQIPYNSYNLPHFALETGINFHL